MALWIKVIYHCLVEVLVERDSTSTHVNGSPSFRLKLWASIKQRQTTVAHTTCWYCSVRSYALVRQPFLKWLYTLCSGLFVSQRGWGERKESALTSLWRGKSRPAIARWKFQIICSQGCSVFSQISNKPREFFEPLFFLAPPLRFRTIRHLRRHLRPHRLRLCPENSPLQSQNIY